MSIILIYHDLPSRICALTHANDDGSYTIFVNQNICHERQLKAVLHELSHIERNDFTSEEQADLLEKMLHAHAEMNIDLSQFQFFIAM